MSQNNQVTIKLTISGQPQRVGEAISRLLAALPAAAQLEALEDLKGQSGRTSPVKNSNGTNGN